MFLIMLRIISKLKPIWMSYAVWQDIPMCIFADCFRIMSAYHRMNIWLERQGIYFNPKTVLRVMQKYNLLSVVRRKKFKYVSEHLHEYPNLLNREFETERPNKNG